MDSALYSAYVDILREELVPAMGCTEPIAVAYAGALARKTLGTYPSRIELGVSGNIIKNVKSVIVPHTGGRKGLPVAVAAGARIGDADAQLAFLIFGDVAEFALHGLARLADGFGIAQKRPACVGELKRRAAHKERAAELLFKSRNVGRERLLRDVQRFSSAGEVFLPREHEKIVKRMEIHGNAPFTAAYCRIYQF